MVGADGRTEAVSIARMTASGFRVAGVQPVLGRPLADADERPGAPSVVVIGQDIWRRHFGEQPDVLGQTLQLGRTAHTVVGVMPDGFAFPINQRLWIPLATDPTPYARRRGPAITMFGRLAPGVTMATAAAELAAIGDRASAAFPDTHRDLRPRVVRYTELWFDDGPRAQMHAVQALVSMLLVVVAVNVAILVYARTAMRQGEIAVRTALGGTRRRIVAQLFLEALVLSGLAAATGLTIAAYVLRQAHVTASAFGAIIGGLPFWMTFRLSTGTIAYVAVLAIAGAAIVGVVPALKATGRQMLSGLQAIPAGGGSGLRLGRTWTMLIVLQVAFAVALLPGSLFMTWQSLRAGTADSEGVAREFLVARIAMDRDSPPTADAAEYERRYATRYAERLAELVRRVEADPAVAAVTLALPEPGGESEASVTVAPAGGGPPIAARTRIGRVDLDFFDVFDVALLAGRRFTPADRLPGARAVIVNRAFADQYAPSGAAIGRQVTERVQVGSEDTESKFDTRQYEIVGVVSDFPHAPAISGAPEPRLYHLLDAGALWSRLAIRVRNGRPAEFGGRLHEITAALDPSLRLVAISPLTDVVSEERIALQWGAVGFGIVTLCVVLLSSAGIHALMSFSVTRRRREIGIRVALGADRRDVLRSVFSRALLQLGAGVVLGGAAALLIDAAMDGGLMGGYAPALLPAVAVLMTAVGLVASFGPARRGQRVDPTEALRAE